MSHPETVPVEQVDREAAADLYAHAYDDGSLGFIADEYLAGEHDDDEFVQSFARHRISALQAAAERERVLVEALRPFADCCEYISDDEDDEEWAKFRLLIKDYRRARQALGGESA